MSGNKGRKKKKRKKRKEEKKERKKKQIGGTYRLSLKCNFMKFLYLGYSVI